MKGCRNQNKVKSSLGFTAISLKVPTEWRGLKMFPECEVRETRRLPSKERAALCTLTCGSVLCCWDSLLSPCGFWITFKTWLSLAVVFLEMIPWFSNRFCRQVSSKEVAWKKTKLLSHKLLLILCCWIPATFLNPPPDKEACKARAVSCVSLADLILVLVEKALHLLGTWGMKAFTRLFVKPLQWWHVQHSFALPQSQMKSRNYTLFPRSGTQRHLLGIEMLPIPLPFHRTVTRKNTSIQNYQCFYFVIRLYPFLLGKTNKHRSVDINFPKSVPELPTGFEESRWQESEPVRGEFHGINRHKYRWLEPQQADSNLPRQIRSSCQQAQAERKKKSLPKSNPNMKWKNWCYHSLNTAEERGYYSQTIRHHSSSLLSFSLFQLSCR